MNRIENRTFDEERALYAVRHTEIANCAFQGPADGESALKECTSIAVKDSFFDLRYPLWHGKNITIENCVQTENCRAAMWYDKNLKILSCKLNGIKAVRECRGVTLEDDEIISPEFGWRSRGIDIKNTRLDSVYAFFEGADITAEGLELKGKYTFQYIKNCTFKNCRFETKDAFWHSKNVTVYDSFIGGEYLAWYSQNLTLVRCHIRGTQPLCYCKNLTLIDCTTEDCDLTFEYSDVTATIKGGITSVKNPESGKIYADGIGELIITSDSKRKITAEVYSAGKKIYPEDR